MRWLTKTTPQAITLLQLEWSCLILLSVLLHQQQAYGLQYVHQQLCWHISTGKDLIYRTQLCTRNSQPYLADRAGYACLLPSSHSTFTTSSHWIIMIGGVPAWLQSPRPRAGANSIVECASVLAIVEMHFHEAEQLFTVNAEDQARLDDMVEDHRTAAMQGQPSPPPSALKRGRLNRTHKRAAKVATRQAVQSSRVLGSHRADARVAQQWLAEFQHTASRSRANCSASAEAAPLTLTPSRPQLTMTPCCDKQALT